MPPFANPSEGVLGGGPPVPSVAWEILNPVRHYPHRPSSPSLGCILYGPYMSLHIPTNLRVLRGGLILRGGSRLKDLPSLVV